MTIFLFLAFFHIRALLFYSPDSTNSYYNTWNVVPCNYFNCVPNSNGFNPLFFSDIASSQLDDLEKSLHIDMDNFVSTKNQTITHLQKELDTNEREIKLFVKILKTSGTEKKALQNQINKRRRYSQVLRNQLKLVNEIAILVTKIEAAKYLAKARSRGNSFGETTESNIKQNIPASEYNIPQAGYGYYQPSNQEDVYASLFPNDDAYAAAIAAVRSHIEQHLPNPTTSESMSAPYPENWNTQQNTLSKRDSIQKAIDAIENIENRLGFNEQSIKTLITSVNLLAKRESQAIRQLVRMQKKSEISSHSIYSPNDTVLNQLELLLIDSDSRLRMLRQIEWTLTQIEALKFYAKLKMDQ